LTDGTQLLKEVVGADPALEIAKYFTRPSSEENGRISLLAFLRELVSGRGAIQDMEARVGIPSTKSLPLEEWAVWVFRDLQAHRLIAGK
jgi:hypothetical protein